MGTYFNPSNAGFRKAAKDEIYIDKSGLLNLLNRKLFAEKNCISVSHARRFGKSQAARMIDAYYSKGHCVILFAAEIKWMFRCSRQQ